MVRGGVATDTSNAARAMEWRESRPCESEGLFGSMCIYLLFCDALKVMSWNNNTLLSHSPVTAKYGGMLLAKQFLTTTLRCQCNKNEVCRQMLWIIQTASWTSPKCLCPFPDSAGSSEYPNCLSLNCPFLDPSVLTPELSGTFLSALCATVWLAFSVGQMLSDWG